MADKVAEFSVLGVKSGLVQGLAVKLRKIADFDHMREKRPKNHISAQKI